MMQLIVLGIIPGTSIQMTFELLANIGALFFAAYVVARMYNRYVRNLPSFQAQKPKTRPRKPQARHRKIDELELDIAHEQLTHLLFHQA